MEYDHRIKSLQNKLQEEKLSAALLFYSRDILYYTGTAQPAYLVVFPEDYFLFIRSGLEFALNDVFIPKEKITEERTLENVCKSVFKNSGMKQRIGTELDILTVDQFYEYKRAFPGYEFVNLSPIVFEQRKRKDASEISIIKKACQTIDMGHRAVLETLKEGITELELAAAIENAHRLAGHEGTFFIRQPDFFMGMGPVSSGPNLFKISGVVYSITGVGLSPAVPAGPSRRSISAGEVVIVDIPILVEGYHADQTRSYTLGRADEKVRTLYSQLKEIADYLIQTIEPGLKCSEIYQMAIEKSKELKVADAFLNFGKGKMSRIIGHGVGLELNEPPILSTYDDSEVSDGYVVALDMHMMDEDMGVVKLEDMILITDEGNEILTRSPRHLVEL